MADRRVSPPSLGKKRSSRGPLFGFLTLESCFRPDQFGQ